VGVDFELVLEAIVLEAAFSMLSCIASKILLQPPFIALQVI
jgi:hypothetical protein